MTGSEKSPVSYLTVRSDFCEEYGIKLDVLMDEVTEYEDGKVFYQDGCLPGEAVETGCEMSIKVAKH